MNIYKLCGSPVIAHYGKWYHRKLPTRLTMSHNPVIYGWLWWNFSWDDRVIH